MARDAHGPSHRRGEVLIYSNEGGRAAHIHIEQAGALAKFWLESVVLASSGRFSGRELRRLEQHVLDHREQFLEAAGP